MSTNTTKYPRRLSCFTLTTVTLLFLAAYQFAYSRDWSSITNSFTGIPDTNSIHLETTVFETGHLRLIYRSPHLTFDSMYINGRSWTYIDLYGETKLWEAGKPSLPAIVRAVRLPNKGSVTIRILSTQYHDSIVKPVVPQYPLSTESTDTPPFLLDNKTYRNNAWYPEQCYKLGDPAIMRDARTALFVFYPVQYNPVSNTIRIFDEISFELIPNNEPSINELTTPPKPVPGFASLYRDIIGADELVTENENAPPGQILIVSNDTPSILNVLSNYTDWKNASGHSVLLYHPSEQMYDPAAIKTYIQSVYNTANPPLESVILVGEGGMGTPYLPSYYYPAEFTVGYTDQPFAELAGNDVLADVFISRFSTSNTQALQTIVNRTINYEKNPPVSDTAYFTSGWGYAGTSHGVYSNRTAIQFDLEMMRSRGIINTHYDEHSAGVNYQTIQQATSHIMLWAHRAAWTGELNPSMFLPFNNPNRPFVSLNLTCSSGDWYGDNVTGIHEALTRFGSPALPTGALSGMSTYGHVTHPAYNNVIATGVYYGFGVNYALNPGAMYFEGKFQLWRNFEIGTPGSVTDFTNWNNVMGDVTPRIWTAVPQSLICNTIDSVTVDQTQITCSVIHIEIPVPHILVTAWKKNSSGQTESFANAFTDSAGQVTLPLTLQSPGNLIITATGLSANQNYLPAIDTIIVTSSPSPLQLSISDYSIDDDSLNGTSGNSNHQLNPGETINILPGLHNSQSSSILSPSGIVHCLDPRVTILDSTLQWVTIGSNQTFLSNEPMQFTLSNNFRVSDSIRFTISVTTGTRHTNVSFSLQVQTATLVCDSSVLVGATVLEPGMNVNARIYVHNTGLLALSTPCYARLISLTPGISVPTDTAVFDSIPIGTEVTFHSTSLWSVSASPQLSTGTPAAMMAIVTNGAIADTLYIQFPTLPLAATMPTGPDAYGYRAFDQTDVAYPYAPVYNWIEIIDNSVGQRLPLNDTTYNIDSSVVIRLPFTAQYYGNRYDSLTICSNGWAAFGRQPGYNNFRNWRLPSTEGPRNLLAVFWEDLIFAGSGSGVYTHFDSTLHQLVISWRTVTTFGAGANEFQLVIRQQDFWSTPTGDAPILFQYKSFHNMPGDSYEPDYASIGIEDNSRRRGLEYTYWDSYSPGSNQIQNSNSANASILFTTAPSDSFLHVFSPVGRDTLHIGSSYRITWGGRRAFSNVKIELNRHYPIGTWETIISSTPNNGVFNWTVTDSATNIARFRILSLSGAEGDTTPPIVINSALPIFHLSFADSTVLAMNFPMLISWTGSNLTGTVSISLNRYYPDSSWTTLFSSIPATDLSVPWTVTGQPSDSVRIRILSNEFLSVGDTSCQIRIVPPPWFRVTPYPIQRTLAPDDTGNVSYSLLNMGQVPVTGSVITNTGIDGFTYLRSVDPGGPNYQWISPHTPATSVITFPFDFPYFDTTYNSVRVSGYGWITFSQVGGGYGTSPQALLYTLMQTFLTVYWTPSPISYDSIMYGFTQDYVVIGWKNMYASNGNFDCEVILYRDGTIVYQYNANGITANSETIGLQSADHTQYFNVYYRENLPPYLAIKFYNSHKWASPTITTFSMPPNSWLPFHIHWDARGNVNGDTLLGSILFSANDNTVQTSFNVRMYVHVNDVANRTAELPKEFHFYPCYPNPFNPSTEIEFDLAKSAQTRIDIYNVVGRKVATLVNEIKPAGHYTARFDASALAAGVYFVRLQSDANTAIRKIVLVK